MKISDRDKKIIVILLIIAVVALPYVLITKPTQEKSAALDAEIIELTERYNYLYDLDQKKDDFIKEIAEFNANRDKIIASYAKGIRHENTVMFLRGIELSEETPITMTTVSFGDYVITPISAETVNADGTVSPAIDALSTQTSVVYNCQYEDLKELLALILDEEKKRNERMVISSIDIVYDDATGTLDGLFVLDQYAIIGEGRELEAAVIPPQEHGNDSVFGTWISDEELREKIYGPDDEGEGEDAEADE